MSAKKEYVHRMQWQYEQANKKQKSKIVDAVIAATGYHRKYAIAQLKKSSMSVAAQTNSRQSLKRYDENIKRLLVEIWTSANRICSKRLAPFLPEYVSVLERFGHLKLSDQEKNKLLNLSPSTIDRLLKGERTRQGRGKSTTRPANLLKQRIKVRTFSEWTETNPGFFECDLVAHCGDRVAGNFLNTLVLTDVNTGWTEFAPLFRKSDDDVAAALDAISNVLPFPILGLDSDNGSEFINERIFSYCEDRKITFTRSRPYKKNDQAHVEQKNGNIIRRTVGYERFQGADAWNRILELYRVLRLYTNFYQPSCKLLAKVRTGAKVTKTYDDAKTPYQRLMESSDLPSKAKKVLAAQYNSLDPVSLFAQIGQLQAHLLCVADQEDQSDEGTDTLVKPVDNPLTLKALRPARKLKRGRSSRELLLLEQHLSESRADIRKTVQILYKNKMSISAIARQLEMSRNTVAKYLRDPEAPKYRLTKPRSRTLSTIWHDKVKLLICEKKGTEELSASAILKKLKADGFAGSRGTVRNIIADINAKPRRQVKEPQQNQIHQILMSEELPALAATR